MSRWWEGKRLGRQEWQVGTLQILQQDAAGGCDESAQQGDRTVWAVPSLGHKIDAEVASCQRASGLATAMGAAVQPACQLGTAIDLQGAVAMPHQLA